jgi:hypothetical protein
MPALPIIAIYNQANLDKCLRSFSYLQKIHQEVRTNFTANFALHNRYFSNGDKPYVVLVKKCGQIELIYNNKPYHLSDGEFVFFDDNVSHSWSMINCDLEIIYYQQVGDFANRVIQGDYCLDDFFQAS